MREPGARGEGRGAERALRGQQSQAPPWQAFWRLTHRGNDQGAALGLEQFPSTCTWGL